MTPAVFFDATLRPNRSLDRRGFVLLLSLMTALNLVVALNFVRAGGWPILPFLGLDIAGLILAFAIGGGIAFVAGGSTPILVIGITIGALIFFTFVMISSLFSSYTSTAYHTCLYIWARDVETATIEGRSTQVAAPAPLAAALA